MIDVTDGFTLHTGRMSTFTASRTRILRHASAVMELLSMYRCMVAALLAHIECDMTDGGVAAGNSPACLSAQFPGSDEVANTYE